jgi:protein CpxP
MKKRNFIVGSVVAAGLLATAGVASARGPGDCGSGGFAGAPVAMHGERFGGGPLHGALRGLDLSDQQRDKIFDIMHAQAPALRDKMKVLRTERDKLREASFTSGFDAKRVRELADAEAKTMAEVQVMHAETTSRIFALLTPEQQKQVVARAADGRSRGAGRW